MGALITSLVEAQVPVEKRIKIYTNMIEVFQHEDCDTLEECLEEDHAFDEAMKPYLDTEY